MCFQDKTEFELMEATLKILNELVIEAFKICS